MIDDDALVDPAPGAGPLSTTDHRTATTTQLERHRGADDSGADHDGIGGRATAHVSALSSRRELITPVSNPPRRRLPWNRACSIFRQRSITTVKPAAVPRAATSSCQQAELQPQGRGAGGDRLVEHGRQVVVPAEHVDEVGHDGQGVQRRVHLAAEDLGGLGVDEVDVVVGAGQQVGRHEVAGASGVR